jgi:DNA polymerase-3 subunit epsilon
VAAGRVFQAIQEKFAGAPELALTPSELHDAQVLWAKAQAESFAKYLAGKGETSKRPGDGMWPVFNG